MSSISDADALDGRLLFAIPKKGPTRFYCFHGSDSSFRTKDVCMRSVLNCWQVKFPGVRFIELSVDVSTGADIQFRRHHRLDVCLVKNHPIALYGVSLTSLATFLNHHQRVPPRIRHPIVRR